jgi:hypothetical protein
MFFRSLIYMLRLIVDFFYDPGYPADDLGKTGGSGEAVAAGGDV